MTTRTARCACGRVEVVVDGDPVLIAACHCDFCQKRTGSTFGFQAYFTEEQCVEIVGDTKVYSGLDLDGVESQAGRAQTPRYHFCTTCGSTLYWTVEDGSGHGLVAVAVGNLVDQEFPAPMREYYTELRHHWISPATTAEQFQRFPHASDRLRDLGG